MTLLLGELPILARNVKRILFNLKQSKGFNSNALQMTHKPRTFFIAFGIY